MSDHLSTNEWMVIFALKKDPRCKIIGDQAETAEKMVGDGLLLRSAKNKGEYSVTSQGWMQYYHVVTG